MKPFVTRVCLFVVCASVIVAPCTNAFDASRKGFVLGFGVGPGGMEPELDFTSFLGFQTDLKIGGGVSDRTLIHYSGKQYWFTKDEVYFTLANPMVGITHYVRESSPSAFITGGAGLAIVVAVWRDDAVVVGGLGSFAGAGYEFAPHWNVELNVIHNRFADNTLWNFTLTLNVLGY